MASRNLRGNKIEHRQAADAAMQEVQRKIEMARGAIKEGSCTRAYMNVVEMWEALGRSDANGRWAGRTSWQPMTEIQELGYEFSTRCLRDAPIVLEGRRRRRNR